MEGRTELCGPQLPLVFYCIMMAAIRQYLTMPESNKVECGIKHRSTVFEKEGRKHVVHPKPPFNERIHNF